MAKPKGTKDGVSLYVLPYFETVDEPGPDDKPESYDLCLFQEAGHPSARISLLVNVPVNGETPSYSLIVNSESVASGYIGPTPEEED